MLSVILVLPCSHVFAADIPENMVFGMQSTKTVLIRPFEPVERDILPIYNLVYESLITIDDDYNPRGCLAESWECSSDGKLWTFHLRTDVSFSDGTPLTARDVVASANYILDKAKDENITDHGFYSNLKYFISSISAKDDSTVTVKAARRYYGLLYAMTFPVVPESMVQADNPLGTGPYLIGEFHAGQQMWLTANTRWWKAQPKVRDISFLFHTTARSLVESYEYAQIDAAYTRSIAGAQYKTGTSSITMSFRTNQLECLLMNNSSSELTPEVRKAIRFLIDRNKIITNVYSGMAKETNFPFYPGTWMYNSALDDQFYRDVDEAKRLLAEAGWEDSDENNILDRINSKGELRNLSLRFYYYEEPDNDVRAEAVNQIVESLAEVGIACRVEAMTMANMKSKLEAGSYDLALASFAMDVCPDPGFMLMSDNVRVGNYSRYRNDRMDELCKSLRTQVTQDGFRQDLMRIQERFSQDCPFVCLYWRMGNVITRNMYTTCRDVREYEVLRGIESYAVQ